MNFKISNIENYTSPAELNVDAILRTYGTSLGDIKKAMIDAVFVHRNPIEGFQIELHEQLRVAFERHFQYVKELLYGGRYSPRMSEMPDVDVGRTGTNQRIFIEIEFHPSEYKDIVKFLIGHKKQTLELGILIIAMNGETKKKINKRYPTMPIYEKCVQIVKELQSDCPILVMGFEGRWVSAEE
ncbi:MAG: hypothetical protein ABR913_07210 [Sedimentisphaerales bacterium]